jgi:phosphatidylglycerophosphate synthase
VNHRWQPSQTRVEEYGVLFRVYERTIFKWAAGLLPARLRPNVITVTGQCCAVLAAMAAAGAVGGRPYLYPVSATLHFGFLFADNLDGMHARRTGQVSRVGEFLDHGLDGIASISALLTVAFIMRVDGMFLPGLAYLGTMAFVAAYWEQYRTGLLVCPAIGQSEGFTAIAAMELALFAFHDPPALRFSHTSFTIGTLLVAGALVGYLGATLASIARAANVGVQPRDMAVVALAGLVTFGYVRAGAEPWIPGVLMGLFGADVVARSLRMRKQGRLGSLVGWPHVGLTLPLLASFVPGLPWSASTWAGLAVALAAVVYTTSIARGVNELRARG